MREPPAREAGEGVDMIVSVADVTDVSAADASDVPNVSEVREVLDVVVEYADVSDNAGEPNVATDTDCMCARAGNARWAAMIVELGLAALIGMGSSSLVPGVLGGEGNCAAAALCSGTCEYGLPWTMGWRSSCSSPPSSRSISRSCSWRRVAYASVYGRAGGTGSLARGGRGGRCVSERSSPVAPAPTAVPKTVTLRCSCVLAWPGPYA